MVDSRREVPVANEHFKALGYTVPQEILALVTSKELEDLSWHNDASPSYGLVVDNAATVSIFVEHPSAKKRSERLLTDRRFLVDVFSINRRVLDSDGGDVCATNDAEIAVKAWRETVADIKAKLEARKPKTCEACNIPLTPDLQCPKCGVSHSGEACATCGRFGLHKDDCTEPPGHNTEGGPANLERLSKPQVLELAKTFERAYQYYNGWGFSFEHPGLFSYYQLGGDLTVYFTPEYDEAGVVPVQTIRDGGDSIGEPAEHEFKTDRSAPALFRIVKPYLDKLSGKKSADLTK